MTRNDWLFLATFFGAFAAVGALILIFMYAPSAIAAAWVQAVGSILAVGGAAGVGIWQTHKQIGLQSSAGARRAQALKYRLTPLVQDISTNVVRVINMATLYDYGRTKMLWIRDSDPSDAIRQMSIDVSWRDNIYEGLDDLPGDLGATVAKLLYEVATYDREITKLLTEAGERGTFIISDDNEIPMIDNYLTNISIFCDAVLNGLRAIH